MRRVSKCLLGAAVLLLLGKAVCSANLVTYTDVKGRYDVMVMEESGADVRELYSPTLYASGNAITRQQSDGSAWIAFMSGTYDLYKISADGLEPATKLLCSRGQYTGEDSQLHPYFLSGFPTWSPDGRNLLLLLIDWDTGAYFHALLGATALATEDCQSDLQPIPYEPQEPGYENYVGGWELIPSATWNDDGSKIAFLEAEYDANDWVIDVQLAILENGEAGWTTRRVPMDSNVEVPWNLYRSNLDWQRGGDTLAFSQRTTSRTTPWLYWVDATTGDWGPMTIDGVAVEGHAPTWSPDGTTLMYSNAQFKLVTRPYLGSGVLGDPETTVGSGGFADWQRNALDLTCTIDADCDDGNECTTDSCVAGTCSNSPLNGDECGDDGWCVDGTCFEPDCTANADCDDLNECTTEACVDYACVVTYVAVETPCTDDGDFCTVDACDGAGTCESVYDPEIEGCEPVCGIVGDTCSSGADCCSGLCHPVKGVCK